MSLTTLLRRSVACLACVATMSVGLAARAEDPAPLSLTGCTGDPSQVIRFSIEVDGEPSTGRYSLPSTFPKGIVVIAHGYSHTTASWVEHMKNIAQHGLIAVGMDYRGTTVVSTNPDGSENARGWPARKGAQDLIAAAKAFNVACPSVDTIVAFGVSMGGNMSGLAVSESHFKTPPSPACPSGPDTSGVCVWVPEPPQPLFDHWFDIEGAVNVIETHYEARGAGRVNQFAAQASEDIQAENGGKTFEQDPAAYEEITVVTKAGAMRSAGLRGIVVIHGADDGLVPYNQSREMVLASRRAAIPTEEITVTIRDEGEAGTTLTGNTGVDFGLAGHASEKSSTHAIMRAALERLFALFSDQPQICDRVVVKTADTVNDSGCIDELGLLGTAR